MAIGELRSRVGSGRGDSCNRNWRRATVSSAHLDSLVRLAVWWALHHDAAVAQAPHVAFVVKCELQRRVAANVTDLHMEHLQTARHEFLARQLHGAGVALGAVEGGEHVGGGAAGAAHSRTQCERHLGLARGAHLDKGEGDL